MRVCTQAVLALVMSASFVTYGWSASADRLLPSTTKGFISLPDLKVAHERWDSTQLGKLATNPALKPFIEDLQRQVRERLNETGEQLGLTWDDVSEVYGGEVCFAHIEPSGEDAGHAVVLIVDTSNHTNQAETLVAKIVKTLQEKGAKPLAQPTDVAKLQAFELPKKRGATHARNVILVHHHNRLILGDHAEVVSAIAKRVELDAKGQALTSDDLASSIPYRTVMERCSAAPAVHPPDAQWFVEPFGYARILRASHATTRRRGEDRIKILQEQGFDAILGTGGVVYLSHNQEEIQHRTFIYAPDDEHASDGNRFRLAARVLDFPSSEKLAQPYDWVPDDISTHATFHWNMQGAFDHVGSLIDKFVSEGFFEDVLDSLAHDPDGPRLDIRKELVANLGTRVTVLVDHVDPITPESERVLVALELKNDEAVKKVAESLDRALSSDPSARRIEVGTHTVWEFFEPEDDAELKIEGIEHFESAANAPAPGNGQMLWSNAAICVANGQLLLGSKLGIVEKILQPAADFAPLRDNAEFQRLQAELNQLGAGNDSARVFTRQDESLHPSYELWKQGKMPESKTILGRVLNRMLAPQEKGTQRKQQIDGSQLPDYNVVAPHLGPSGLYVKTQSDGWYVTGTFLPKSPMPLTSKDRQHGRRTARMANTREKVNVTR